MKRILCTILMLATFLALLWTTSFAHAQSQSGRSEIHTIQNENNLSKIAMPEHTVATFGNGSSAMALLDGNTSSGYQLMALGKDCHVTLDFGNTYPVARVRVFTYNQNYAFRLSASLDGKDYVTVAENEMGVHYSTETGYVVDIPVRECRFLRLDGLEGQFGYFSLYEIEVYADFSVKNPLCEVSLPYNTTATLAGEKNAAKLVDGAYTGSYQMIPEGDNCYAEIDLGKAYNLRRATVYTYSENYRFRIEGSLDGKNYQYLGENLPEATYDANIGYSIPIEQGLYRYIRLVGLSGQYGYFSLYEIDLFADLTPTKLLPEDRLFEVSLPGHATVRSATGSEFSNLVDGNVKGSYRMLPEGENCYVTIDLTEEYTVQKVTVYTYGEDYGFALEGSLDGVNFLPLGVNDLSQEYDPEKGYSVTVTGGTYRYLRIKGQICPYGFFSLYEIDVFATKSVPVKADVNWDMVINVEDLNLLLTALSTDAYLKFADLDGNGVLNVNDLNELLIILSTQE